MTTIGVHLAERPRFCYQNAAADVTITLRAP
jgi:hypothetical protein